VAFAPEARKSPVTEARGQLHACTILMSITRCQLPSHSSAGWPQSQQHPHPPRRSSRIEDLTGLVTVGGQSQTRGLHRAVVLAYIFGRRTTDTRNLTEEEMLLEEAAELDQSRNANGRGVLSERKSRDFVECT